MQVGDRRMPLRDWEAGHLIAAEDVIVLNFLRHRNSISNGLLHHSRVKVIGKQPAHLLFTLEIFSAGVTKAFLVADQLAREHAEEGVMGFHVMTGQVVGIVGGHHLNTELLGDLDDLHIHNAIFGRAVILDLKIKILSEHLLVPPGHVPGHIGSLTHDGLRNLSA